MMITDTRIRLLPDAGKMLAVASITFDDCFVVHDIKVIDGAKGVFVAMPSKKMGDGNFADIAHQTDTETRYKIQRVILEAYDAKLREEMSKGDAEETAARFI